MGILPVVPRSRKPGPAGLPAVVHGQDARATTQPPRATDAGVAIRGGGGENRLIETVLVKERCDDERAGVLLGDGIDVGDDVAGGGRMLRAGGRRGRDRGPRAAAREPAAKLSADVAQEVEEMILGTRPVKAANA